MAAHRRRATHHRPVLTHARRDHRATVTTTPDPYAARLLRLFGPPPHSWVRESSADHDVLVVGGGQAGLGIGFALRRAGVERFSVVDAAEPADKGVWRSVARMRRLRTPKAWPEPEYGFPELSFRAWYELDHSPEEYDAVERIDRLDWAAYVDWVEQVLGVPVRHRTRVVGLAPAGDHLAVELEVTEDGGTRRVTETTRKLVFANGVEGTGAPAYPPGFEGLPAHLAAHTADRIDFTALAGRRVAVVGAGASALDAAASALEAGAAEAHLFTRRDQLLVQGPAGYGPQSLGARENYHRLSDADRWAQKLRAARAGRTCTLDSVRRAAVHDGFRVHLSAAWLGAGAVGDRVLVEAADGRHEFDFVIAGTGYRYDPATSPELAGVAHHVALWSDVYRPPADQADVVLGEHPYLGEAYELREKHPGQAPWLGRVHVFNAGAAMSFGMPVGDTQSLPTGIPRLVDALARDLYFEDRALPAAPAAPAGAKESYRSTYEHAIWAPAADDELQTA